MVTSAFARLAIVGFAVLLTACGDDGRPIPSDSGTDSAADSGTTDSGVSDAGDGGPVDGGPDTGADTGADAGPVTAAAPLFSSSAGGRTSSASFQLRLSVGAPQPMGEAASAGHQLLAGPSAAHP